MVEIKQKQVKRFMLKVKTHQKKIIIFKYKVFDQVDSINQAGRKNGIFGRQEKIWGCIIFYLGGKVMYLGTKRMKFS